MRAPELEPCIAWCNTNRPLSLREDLAGHVVLLEFWAPGRIEGRHAAEDLAWFKAKYRNDPFVVVGVCGAETPGEATPALLRAETRRRGVDHPVVLDDRFRIWQAYHIKRWPSFVLIDPKGVVVGQVAGEGNRMLLDRYIARLLADHRLDRTLAPARLTIEIPPPGPDAPLREPEGVIAVAPRVAVPGRLFIADTGHGRVILADWPDAQGSARVRSVFGAHGPMRDGSPHEARFARPAGLALDPAGDRLFVADPAHHAVRMIELKTGLVRTIAGTGQLGGDSHGGAAGVRQALRSPHGLAYDAARQRLLIAMEGDHRVWSIDLTTMVARPIAGAGRPRVADGPLDAACFWQPAAIVLPDRGGSFLVADAAGSAVREIDESTGRVRTIAGLARDPAGEDPVLSDSGDADGLPGASRLRRPAGLAWWATTPLNPAGDRVLIADTGNGKLRLIDPARPTTETWAGAGLAAPVALSVALPRTGEAGSTAVFVADGDRILRIDPGTREPTEIRFDPPPPTS